MRFVPLVLLAAACSGGSATSPGDTDTVPRWSTQDTDPTTGSTSTSTDATVGTDTDTTTVPSTMSLSGTVPASPLGPPTFASVRNLDGTDRVPADLVGHPTVMWFYPAAGTGG